ncbi:MAG: type II toxin-antitoxin system antitoxin, RelB/DinJ family [Bifidobacteriales bacterium]|nr:type II toxin-antitoxin system antitoxin, RelB/DinJ family [Bifidobacteriales bacterium]
MKRRTSQLFEELGLDLGTAINMVLSQSLREGGLPFRSRLSNLDREMEEAEASPVTHSGDVENMKDTIHHV